MKKKIPRVIGAQFFPPTVLPLIFIYIRWGKYGKVNESFIK